MSDSQTPPLIPQSLLDLANQVEITWPLILAAAVAIFAVTLLVRAAVYPIGSKRRDPTRLFPWSMKRSLIDQAGGRCEHKHPLWKRCPAAGKHADHIIPWSRGGPTALWNGQLLCVKHNLAKSNSMPTRLYQWRLRRRRQRY